MEIYPWQEKIWQSLSKRPFRPNNYIFQGPKGIGKFNLTNTLVTKLLCDRKGSQLNSCGTCKSCFLIKSGFHPNRYTILLEKNSKIIKVDQIRKLTEFVSSTSQLGGLKAVIINPAEAMNSNACNALLKILEEPLAKIIFILITDNYSYLPLTIRSRCIPEVFSVPSMIQSLDWLKQGLPNTLPQERIDLLYLAGGSPLIAVELYRGKVKQKRSLVVAGVKSILKKQNSVSRISKEWANISLKLLLDWFYEWSFLIMRFKLTNEETDLGIKDMSEVLRYLAERTSRVDILSFEKWVIQQRHLIFCKNSNLNHMLLIESLLLRWAKLLRI